MARKPITPATRSPKKVNVLPPVQSGALPAAAVATFRVGEQPVPRAHYIRAIVPSGTDPALVEAELAKARQRARHPSAVKVEREPAPITVTRMTNAPSLPVHMVSLREQAMQRCPDDAATRACVDVALSEAGL